MTILDIAILIFVVMELSNVLVMYFKPDFKYANSMAVFKQWAESQQDEKQRLFVKYLVNRVADCKLIFIALLLVVVFFANEQVKIFAVVAMIVSIAMYFVSLHSIIRKLDKQGQITPQGIQ